MGVEEVCREHCEGYKPKIAWFTSVLDYEQCLSDCKELYKLLLDLAMLIEQKCREEASQKPKIMRARFFKSCLEHNLGLIVYNQKLAEKFLRLIANDMGINL